jgi:RNA-directed DNA polymerase
MVDADVRGAFASMDRTRRREVLRQRVNDGSLGRLLGKWRRAGVLAHGVLTHPETGVVQGGVLSPVRAKIVLQPGLDAWCEREVQPRLQGRSFLTRFAEDGVSGCELEADAQQSLGVCPKRFARVGRRLHPPKTPLVGFRKPTASQASAQGNGTCECLGVTHDGARTRRGCWGRNRRTARTRRRRTQKAWWPWGRHHRQAPLHYQERLRCVTRRGHLRDYGSRGPCPLLAHVRREAAKAWRSWLRRRRRTRAIDWANVPKRRARSVWPTPTIVHNR